MSSLQRRYDPSSPSCRIFECYARRSRREHLPICTSTHSPPSTVSEDSLPTSFPLALSLSRFPDLEELAIDYSRFIRSVNGGTVDLPDLTKLALSSLGHPSDFASVLASAHLPRLESLVFIIGDGLDADHLKALTAALLPLPKLKSFTLSFAESDMWFAFRAEMWTSMTALQSIALDHDYDIPQVLPHLSPPLARLHIRPPLHSFTPLTLTPLHNALIARLHVSKLYDRSSSRDHRR